MNIGTVTIPGRVTLAPMAGVTDAAFRRLCYQQGAALTCTEMVSARALVYRDKKTESLLFCPPEDRPVAAQIFGHEPEIMAEAAPMALALSGADILDINMGCPVGKVVKSGDGSALMRDPVLAGKIIEAVVNAVDVPVTVKFRKGWDGGNVNAVEFARMCEASGASAIAVHRERRRFLRRGRGAHPALYRLRLCHGRPRLLRRSVALCPGERRRERGAGAAAPAAFRTDGRRAGADPLFRRAEGRAAGLPGGAQSVRVVSARRAARRAV